jgi:hypothetical protein
LLIASTAAVPYGYAVIKDGKVVDTPEVQHAKAAHFAAIAKAGGHANEYSHSGHYGYAEIQNGKVVDTPEVQHAKEAHSAAIAKAGGYATGHDTGDSYAHDYSHNDKSDIKYDGKFGFHYPTIKNGVPVDTDAVQHARAAHLAKVSEANVHSVYKRSADYHHVPVIHNGVPVDTPEVQLAKAAHAAAHAVAQVHGSYDAGHHNEQHHEQKYDGKYGYHNTVIKNGVPVDTEAVQHARAAHMQKLAGANHGPAEEHSSYDEHHYDHYVPTIHNGVPVETPEVQHAKAAHFAAVAVAKAHSVPAKNEKHW